MTERDELRATDSVLASRADAAAIFRRALDAADPARAVREAARALGSAGLLAAPPTGKAPGRLRVIAAGKAAAGMLRAALEEIPPESLAERLASPPLAVVHEEGAAGRGVADVADVARSGLCTPDIIVAAHPVPDARGEAAAAEIERRVAGTRPEDTVLFLLSGGASALLPAPAPGISLADKQETTRLLLASGAAIGEVNAVRKHLSRLKGGLLARLASPARVEAWIVSDVVADDLATIASGPTAPDPTTFSDALAVLERRGIRGRVPPAVLRRLEEGARGEIPETPKPGDPAFDRVTNRILASGSLSLAAAAEEATRRGYEAVALTAALTGESREAARRLGSAVRERMAGRAAGAPPLAILAAGETTVTVCGGGLGGRNQELALAFALEVERAPIAVPANAVPPSAVPPSAVPPSAVPPSAVPPSAVPPSAVPRIAVPGIAVPGIPAPWVLLSAGTDGRDGPTDAAGAIVDGGTLDRGRRAGASPEDFLERNDSYRFLSASGDLLRTGPTGTNVADLQVILVG